MAKKESIPVEFTADIGGTKHVAWYQLDGGLIKVSTGRFGSKTTQLGAMPAETLARQLLRELVRESGGHAAS